MILFDKTALTEKLGRKTANCIDILLTPESEEADVRAALDKLMNTDIEKLSLRYGNEPPEILVAAAVGFLRLKGGDNSSAGTVAVDNINEAISIDPELDNDTIFRNDFIYDLVKAGADQGDPALQAVLCDLYVGDVVSPGLGARFEADGMTIDRLRKAIDELEEQQNSSEEVRQALGVAGISPEQLRLELDWAPYGENGFAKARRFAQDGRAARNDGKLREAEEAFFNSALFGSVESAGAYAALSTEMYPERDRKAEIKSHKIYRRTLKKAEKLGRFGEPDEKLSSLFERAELLGNPDAVKMRAELTESSNAKEALTLLENAADKGSIDAQIGAAEYYSEFDSFDYDKMMRYIFEGLVNPGSWYVFGKAREPFNVLAQDYSVRAYEKMGALLEKLCYERDMIDELEELSEPKEMRIPELSEEQRRSVFMWFLCDPRSDARRQVLARLYATGFGTDKDEKRALAIRRELCEKYAPAGTFAKEGGEAEADDGSVNDLIATGAVIETSEPEESENAKGEVGSVDNAEGENADIDVTESAENAAENAEIIAENAEAEAEIIAENAENVENIAGNAEEKAEPADNAEAEAENVAAEEENAPESAQNGQADIPEHQDEEITSDYSESDFMPYESFYTYALYLITAEGAERDVELGKKLLRLIPDESGFCRKASRLLALTETRTSELLRLGAMFHKEGNDDAMIRIYDAAEKLGSPVAARVLGRFYSLPENGADNAEALRHYALGASRGDVQSMYFAGTTCQASGNYYQAYDYFSACADAGEKAADEDDRSVGARAMRDNAELYYSGAISGEKNVPRYLYWMDRAENAGYKLSDAAIDKRRAAENYFKPAQWQDVFNQAMASQDAGYKEWAMKVCAERKIPAAQEEYGVILYKKRDPRAYAQLKTPALSSPRAQYYEACALYFGVGCEKNAVLAARMMPSGSEYGDPEKMRHEIDGMAACRKAGELGERRADEAADLLKKAEAEFTAVFDEYGRDNVRFELADILIRAYDVPDKYSADELKGLWRRGYRYLADGYRKDGRCTAQIDAYSAGRICEIAGLFDDDEALKWYSIAASRGDAAAQFGAGSILLKKAKSSDGGKVVDADAFKKAKELITRAALNENAGAELAMYTERKLFEIDQDQAKLYLKRSAVHGSEKAADLCRELEIAF